MAVTLRDFFLYFDPNSGRNFGLTQPNFGLTQGNFGLTQEKFLPNSSFRPTLCVKFRFYVGKFDKICKNLALTRPKKRPNSGLKMA